MRIERALEGPYDGTDGVYWVRSCDFGYMISHVNAVGDGELELAIVGPDLYDAVCHVERLIQDSIGLSAATKID